MTERHIEDSAVGETLSRRSLVAGATVFGAAMAAIGEVAKAENAGSGSYSNAAIALPEGAPKTREEQIRAVRIARAMRAGPSVITEHATVAEMLLAAAMRARRQTNLARVALAGGCFANDRLVRRLAPALESQGFEVYVHREVPPGDGGVALGQAYVAAARLQAERP